MTIDWDQLVPESIKQAWLELRNELHLQNNFTVPRLIAIPEAAGLELHGFSDASEKLATSDQ